MSEAKDPFKGKGYVARKTEPVNELSTEQKRPPEQRAAAYRIGQELKNRVSETATRHNVEKGDLVKFLLIKALDQLDAGELLLPTVEPKGPRKIDV